MKLAILALVALAACVPPGPEVKGVVLEPEAEAPPKMGDVTGVLGGVPVAWETYDFSVGAFDASAWIDAYDGPSKWHLVGYPVGQPQADAGKLWVLGDFAAKPVVGLLRGAEVKIVQGSDRDGAALSSEGQTAEVTITALTLPEGSGYGHATGTVTARLCPVRGAKGACSDISLRFDSEIQVSG